MSMRRDREDGYTSRGETNGQSPTIRDALHYVSAVRNTFHDDIGKYETFLEVMKDFRAQRDDHNGVIKRIKVLFNGHNDLILGFNTFLPKKYTITFPLEEEKPKTRVGFQDAFSFVTKIKARFSSDEHAYKRFLDIMEMYRKERKSIIDVYEEVTILFKGHDDLLVEFLNFLPNCAAISDMLPRHSDKVENCDEKLVVFSGGNSTGSRNGQSPTIRDALHYVSAVRNTFHDDIGKYETFLEVMKDFRAQRDDHNGVIKRIKVLFNGHNDLILGFNTFLPKKYTITFPLEEEKPKTRVGFQDAFSFVTKIKARFSSDEHAYKRFLDIMEMYRKERKSIIDVYEEVTILFKGHDDLLVEFLNFLPNCAAISDMLPRHSDKWSSEFKPESLAKEGQGGYLNVAENGRIQDHQSGQDGGRDTDRADKTASSVSQIIASFQRM
ncbi:hypothetical protein HID58_094019 [Brassica napus]|uniref:Uncharacterized protein n=1 Tax=Brassica napus TaxID=3708 RepID=A0ABQ7X9D0_BRANA|nr:hypothetical protein HID58_094019 [Brassica napus]